MSELSQPGKSLVAERIATVLAFILVVIGMVHTLPTLPGLEPLSDPKEHDFPSSCVNTSHATNNFACKQPEEPKVISKVATWIQS